VGSFIKTPKAPARLLPHCGIRRGKQGRQIRAMMEIFLSPRPGLESIPRFPHGFNVGYCLSHLRR
jgi:hypothetical protein